MTPMHETIPAGPPAAPWWGALRAEWIRFWSLRSNVWQCLLLLAWIPGSITLLLISQSQQGAALPAGAALPPLTGTALLDSVLWAQLLVGVCSARFATGEISPGQLGLALLAVPRRWPIVAGKAALLAAVMGVCGAVSAALGLCLAHTLAPHLGVEVTVELGHGAALALLSGAYLAGIAVCCLGIGILVRWVILGAMIPLAVLTIIPAMLESTGIEAVRRAVGFLPSIAGRVAFADFENPAGLDGTSGLFVLTGWAVGMTALAITALRVRDAG